MQHHGLLSPPGLATIALAMVVLGGSAARAEAPSTCSGGITTNSTFGALVVPDNEDCFISGGTVTVGGNVEIGSNASLRIDASGTLSVGGNVAVGSNASLDVGSRGTLSVAGNLSFANGSEVVLMGVVDFGGGQSVAGSLVGDHAGGLVIRSGTIGKGIDIGFSTGGVLLLDVSVAGNVSIHDATNPIGQVRITRTTIGGQVAIANNSLGALEITDNTIGKHLTCFGNAISTLTVSGNTVGGKVQGQCAF